MTSAASSSSLRAIPQCSRAASRAIFAGPLRVPSNLGDKSAQLGHLAQGRRTRLPVLRNGLPKPHQTLPHHSLNDHSPTPLTPLTIPHNYHPHRTLRRCHISWSADGEGDARLGVRFRVWHVEFNPQCKGGLRKVVNNFCDMLNDETTMVEVLQSNKTWSDPRQQNVGWKMEGSHGSVVGYRMVFFS
ncbi:hypothetical protein JAAARDRAFT_60598 [Jaapia argillacea MUCL 33604]|uniref:Uncharacterized protein n=1 Tax=Jaapia argillacea MUCL 33604 TaxID=933084 RepID=A0A067PWA2_9AGAM|nr:hypothetical protein JAAARDRAFT_60598 [Jaapia argillacea MUCL 33604]